VAARLIQDLDMDREFREVRTNEGHANLGLRFRACAMQLEDI
jgi:hypothetical protein